MDAELKAKWVKALRSGEYEQCQYRLHDHGAFCCIGVGYVVKHGEKPSFDITAIAARDLGIDDEQMRKLVHLNDREMRPFTEIADHIEANL